MSVFVAASIAGWGSVVLLARVLRGRAFATFAGVFVLVHLLISVGLADDLAARGVPLAALGALQAAVFLHFASLVVARPRPLAWRLLVSIPAMAFSAATFLAWPWALADLLGLPLFGLAVPYALALLGLVESNVGREETVALALGREDVGPSVERHPLPRRGAPPAGRPLRVVQITDPHLGPMMSAARLARICRRAVEREPDLIVLTGDLLTMESQTDPALLAAALEPLRAMTGRTFACFGNHDYEAEAVVLAGLASAGVRVLRDEEAVVETPAGPVQLVGAEFHFGDRAAHLARLSARAPRRPGHLRLWLLHDPGAFRHVPPGDADLVLSGHTHGGQVGLVTFGLPWTALRLFTRRIPDHGLWARGTDRLYVHRGTGHYGFPLRIGVPSEQSLLEIHPPPDATAPPSA